MISRHVLASLALVLKISAAGLALSGSGGVRAEKGTAMSGPVCMTDPSRGGTFKFPVPEARLSEMEGRGFVVIPCENTMADVAGLQEKICALAERAPQSAKDGFAAANGLSPDELCQLTTQILQGGRA